MFAFWSGDDSSELTLPLPCPMVFDLEITNRLAEAERSPSRGMAAYISRGRGRRANAERFSGLVPVVVSLLPGECLVGGRPQSELRMNVRQ